MGTLTIRTTPEQDQVIEEVQKLLNESAVSKTLLRCVTEYQKLSSIVSEKSVSLENALNLVDELENLISHYLQSQHALMSAVPQRTDRAAQRHDPEHHQQARKNIANIREIFKPNS